jgi:hypothetical protein
MKLKVLLAALLVAGFAASFALAGGTGGADTTTGATTSTSTSTTTTGKGKGEEKKADKPKCQKVELQGSDGTGSVTFTVKKASKKGAALKGKPATLTLATGSNVKATACLDAAGVLTLQHLEVSSKG